MHRALKEKLEARGELDCSQLKSSHAQCRGGGGVDHLRGDDQGWIRVSSGGELLQTRAALPSSTCLKSLLCCSVSASSLACQINAVIKESVTSDVILLRS